MSLTKYTRIDKDGESLVVEYKKEASRVHDMVDDSGICAGVTIPGAYVVYDGGPRVSLGTIVIPKGGEVRAQKRKLLFISAPYTHPDPVVNTNKVCRVATVINEQTEYVPFVPHMNIVWHMADPHPENFWYSYDLDVLMHCDAIVRLTGASLGADREVSVARENGIPVLAYDELPEEARFIWEEF